MACKTSYEFHHNFPKLAEESGFAFNVHRPRVHIDWNKIRLINIEELTRDKNFATLEQHINDIADCVLESEFDVRILDSGVVKLFRLAQLAVEYQQFCRHYLDRSVMLLRDELTAAMQDIERMRKDIRNKEDEIKKIRKRYKHNYRPPLPYGNENIATMILRTLSNKGDIYTPTSTGEGVLPYNKCSYCDKVFLNQLYLQSHISRRHVNANGTGVEINHLIPEKDTNTQVISENETLRTEIATLKKRIEELETKAAEQNNVNSVQNHNNKIENSAKNADIMKNDANNYQAPNLDSNIFFNKLEEWKKEEHERNKTEIENLRTQIIENLSTFKNKEIENENKKHNEIIELLQNTIKEQAIELTTLRQELENANHCVKNENKELMNLAEERENFWMQRANSQRLQYEELMQQLENVRQEARTARQVAEAERERNHQLLETIKHRSQTKDIATSTNTSYAKEKYTNSKPVEQQCPDTPFPGGSLDELHRKAQELLSVVSSSFSDMSNDENIDLDSMKKLNIDNKQISRPDEAIANKSKNLVSTRDAKLTKKKQKAKQNIYPLTNSNHNVQMRSSNEKHKPENKKHCKKKKASLDIKQNFSINNDSEKVSSDMSNISPSSPVKVIRAKLNEQVNNQLFRLGADPLRNGIQASIFTKLRSQLHQEQQFKIKKNSSYEKTRNRILTYVDSNVNKETEGKIDSLQKTSSSSMRKHFNLSTVLSNVKHKALSLMKSTEAINRKERNTVNDEIVKRAAFLLKTPPESLSNSPISLKQHTFNASQNDPRIKRRKDYSNRKGTVVHEVDDFTKIKVKQIRSEGNTSDLGKTTDTEDDNMSEATMSSGEGKNVRNNLKLKNPNKITTSVISHQSGSEKSVETLIKSPVRRPATANSNNNRSLNHNDNPNGLTRSNSTIQLIENKLLERIPMYNNKIITSTIDGDDGNNKMQNVKYLSEDNIFRNSPSTKGVLKNAPSNSSLSKKKVIFDLDANQMKSLSASPSQSTTEKSELRNEIKLSNVKDEFDVSSIEDLPVKNDTKAFLNPRSSSKITELTQRIEAQLARRGDGKPPSAGAIDMMSVPVSSQKPSGSAALSGSNTSLGSSLLDDSGDDHQHFGMKISATRDSVSKKIVDKDASDLDVSDFSIDDIFKTATPMNRISN